MEHNHKNFPTKFLAFLTTSSFLLRLTTALIGSQGEWQLLRNSTGVVAMHMALTYQDTVLMFDQTGFGPSGYRLSKRLHGTRCLGNPVSDARCYAHSVEYHISTNTVRPLRMVSDPFCSSGTFLSNGTLLETGGYANGYRRIRYFHPCNDGTCDWKLSRAKLSDDRWYASNLLLPGENDRVIVVGGQRVFSYEFVPKLFPAEKAFSLPFLRQTYNKTERGNNLYPFLHLSSDGRLFIFANRDSILFDYRRNTVVKTFPRMPGNGSRNYPGSGSSVILPLTHRDRFQKVEVMVCGGGAEGAQTAARAGRFLDGLRTCGRMVITGNKHTWSMENMPHPRLLMDMIILPTGNILFVNGATRGSGGWNNADQPAQRPFLYNPRKPVGKRFSTLKPTKIARMYHSSAILLPDGRVLVGGSNPHQRYTYRNVTYPTELRLQAFAPQYTDKRFSRMRPRNVSVEDSDGVNVKYGQGFLVTFRLAGRPDVLEFNMYAPPFTTHSVAMNQRMLKLRSMRMVREAPHGGSGGKVTVMLEAPPSPNVAPPGISLKLTASFV
ncbi:hypothetical protein Cgig2_034078 [Carnegiea gigantea]|uniref:Glyoxal oxidase n=1 Tax=Carnegiea gigantea TaxID=171969 RepID=A0A9Q1GKP7_9CARY|nr:hypothetical protein Cgig2_005528 [Carnegiea gigantea]KAJ8421991.1 hypothetical protein Cgig2_034078 [Carnegiea gigantea]